MRIAMISEHASPLITRDTPSAQQRHVAELSAALAEQGHEVRVYTRRDDPQLPAMVNMSEGVCVVHVPAGPALALPPEQLLSYMGDFAQWLRTEWRDTAWLPEVVCWKLSDEYHAPKVVGGHVRIYTEGELRRKLSAAGLEPGASHQVHALHTPYWWLRCAVGPQRPIEDHPLTKAYHRLLVWDMVDQPLVTKVAERVLQPVLGKSLVLYARKPTSATVVESSPTSATLGGHARVA